MRISAQEEYGLRCLIALARRGRGRQMSIAEIAKAEGLSVPYASKLLSVLRRVGLVTAVRGRSGGFALARSPSEISLHQAITGLGGPLIDPDHCARYTGQLELCVHTGDCSVHGVLHSLAGFLNRLLEGMSLQDLIDKNASPGAYCGRSELMAPAAVSCEASAKTKDERRTSRPAAHAKR